MFVEVSRGSDILDGALWYEPRTHEIVEVEALEEEDGVTRIMRASLSDKTSDVKIALEHQGFFERELPPEPKRGAKGWDPRPYRPPPKPGYLFWVPDIPIGYQLLEVWEEYVRLANENTSWNEIPTALRKDVLMVVGSLVGSRLFQGSPFESYVIIEKGSGGEESLGFWKATGADVIVTPNPRKDAIRILRKIGVRANG